MDITSSQVESIVRKILGDLNSAPKAAGPIPKTGKVAMLTGEKKIEVKEFAIPALQDDDILVKVEGCAKVICVYLSAEVRLVDTGNVGGVCGFKGCIGSIGEVIDINVNNALTRSIASNNNTEAVILVCANAYGNGKAQGVTGYAECSVCKNIKTQGVGSKCVGGISDFELDCVISIGASLAYSFLVCLGNGGIVYLKVEGDLVLCSLCCIATELGSEVEILEITCYGSNLRVIAEHLVLNDSYGSACTVSVVNKVACIITHCCGLAAYSILLKGFNVWFINS